MTQSSLSQPSPAAVQDELGRILQSSFVPEGSLLAKMLTYVVEQTLAGDDRSIKAYTIAVEALGRPANFEPDRDSTVRVAAMRLRGALDLYYSGPGASSPTRIKMVPGSYRPIFETVAVETQPSVPPAFARLARGLVSTRTLLIVLSAMMTINFAMTISLMSLQMQAQAKDGQPEKSVAVYELIQHDIQRSFGQALD
ncbi:hypothetical protein [Phreatobacter stygius]|uniref:Histidine kinase n=1 Tax=Phreatobacter stygius TaxID=1940610 RepID=A0A4D7B1P3_9HYPH|nr:hypothetical protein [Phreatobacter stygius]QCI66721.1 hypothetical protein E8M01_22260 [Phreatobacter stygius]